VAGVKLWGHPCTFAWQAWCYIRALGCVWWRTWPALVARAAAALWVAGVALGDIHVPFAWQAWRLVTSTLLWPTLGS